MALSPLLDFLKAATGFIRPDEAILNNASECQVLAARYHRRIVVIAGFCGLIAGIGGIIGAVMASPNEKDVKLMLMAPLMCGIIGILEGVAIACLFAPQEFLDGPVGQKWMTLIGTKSVLGARITCVVLSLAIPGVPAILALAASLAKG